MKRILMMVLRNLLMVPYAWIRLSSGEKRIYVFPEPSGTV